MKDGAIDLVAISDKVPAATKTKIEELKKGLKDGSFTIWKGPIKDQAGKEVLKADEKADDKLLLGNQLLRQGRGGQAAEREVSCEFREPRGEL